MEDLYSILGVSSDASDEEIKAAYKKLSIKYHPDKFTDVEEKKKAEKRMQGINMAYSVLSQKNKRKSYDATGNTDSTAGHSQYDYNRQSGGFGEDSFFQDGHNFEFSDIFKQFFNKGSDYFYSGHQPSSLSLTVDMKLDQWFYGDVIHLSYKRYSKCQNCVFKMHTCSACGGKGQLRKMFAIIQCQSCGGRGKTSSIFSCGKTKCSKGRIFTDYKIEVKVPSRTELRIVVSRCGHFNVHTDNYDSLVLDINILPSRGYFLSESGYISSNIWVSVDEVLNEKRINIPFFNEEIQLDLTKKFEPSIVIYRGIKIMYNIYLSSSNKLEDIARFKK